mgnify:CR=1 FL=1
MIMNMIAAILEVIKQLLSVKQTQMTNMPILDAIKDKKNLKKASDITEKIIKIVDNYTNNFTRKDLKEYNKLKDKFNKVN